MRANNALALIFSNSNDEALPELTEYRSMGSVPFGGRYRIIDFHLSNLVNAGVGKVGVIPRSNYRSLMDHIGSGKPWDLDRKKGGLSFLPPFIAGGGGAYKGHIEAVLNVSDYLRKSHEDYVILCDADVVCNIDIADMLEKHIKSGADVTAAYKFGALPKYHKPHTVLELDCEGRAKEILVSVDTGAECNYCIGLMIFRREQLIELSVKAMERGYTSIGRGVLQANSDSLKIMGYKIENFAMAIDGIKAYADANMAVLKSEVRRDLFNHKRPVYTKTRDDMPAKYGLDSSVKNSLIGDGCVIEGSVENCILFRGVKVGKNSRLRDCIVMQSGVIGEGCDIQYVTADKDVSISNGTELKGAEGCHYIIKKGTSI